MSNWLPILAPFLFSCLHCLAEVCSITFYLRVENIPILSEKGQILLSLAYFLQPVKTHSTEADLCHVDWILSYILIAVE